MSPSIWLFALEVEKEKSEFGDLVYHEASLTFLILGYLPTLTLLPPQLKIEKINETTKTISSKTPPYSKSPKGWEKYGRESLVRNLSSTKLGILFAN